MINPKLTPELRKMAAQNKAANTLILALKKIPGVLYAMKVCGLQPQTAGVRLTFDSQASLDAFAKRRTPTPLSPEELSSWKAWHRDEDPPVHYTIKKISIFPGVRAPLHSDLTLQKDHYLLQVRQYFGNEEQSPHWETRHNVEHLPNKQYDKEHPPEENAKALGEGWMQIVFVEEDEEEENEDGDKNYVRPTPIKTEYRIIKVVTTQEVVDYQTRNYDDPFCCVKCQKSFHIKDLSQRRLPKTLGYSLVCKTCDTSDD